MSAAATMRPRSLRTASLRPAARSVPARPGEAADRDERRLEVVRHRVVEALELGVLGREVAALGAQRLLVRAQVARHAVERARQVAELVGRVERQRVVEVARGDLLRRVAHLGERPRERPREQQARQQPEPERRDQHQPAEREQRGAVAAPQLGRALLLERPQRGLPGRLRERDDAPSPPSRRPRRPGSAARSRCRAGPATRPPASSDGSAPATLSP